MMKLMYLLRLHNDVAVEGVQNSSINKLKAQR